MLETARSPGSAVSYIAIYISNKKTLKREVAISSPVLVTRPYELQESDSNTDGRENVESPHSNLQFSATFPNDRSPVRLSSCTTTATVPDLSAFGSLSVKSLFV